MTNLGVAHYENLLARHYTWMLGGDLEAAAASQRRVLEDLGVRPGAVAVDLGCGPGPQTLALADMGFESVIGVDTSQELLGELAHHARSRPAIKAIRADLVQAFPDVLEGHLADVVVCMGDTVLHLAGRDAVTELCDRVAQALAPRGILRVDLPRPHRGAARPGALHAGAQRRRTIMLCVLEYDEPEAVTVNDLIYTRGAEGWQLAKSSYPKLRLAPDWVCGQLTCAGLDVGHHSGGAGGMWTTVTTAPR